MKNKIIICLVIILAFIIPISFSGCSANSNTNTINNTTVASVELNERQIEICNGLGMPTNYDDLSYHQKKYIARIEELLQILDNKYNKHFIYAGYSEKGTLENEWLMAYPDDLNQFYTVTLTVNDDGTMTDDYPEVLASIMLCQDLENTLNEKGNTEFKVFSSECRVFDNTIPEQMSDLNGNAKETFTIIVKGKDNGNNLNDYADYVAAWFIDNGIYGYSNFIMVSDDYFDTVTIINFYAVQVEDDTEVSLSCDISENGKITIY